VCKVKEYNDAVMTFDMKELERNRRAAVGYFCRIVRDAME
jgi:hypothetical protein